MDAYRLLAYLHLLSAVFWLGGMLFLAVVMVPLSRSAPVPRPIAVAVLRLSARRFRTAGWLSLVVAVVTGLLLARRRGLLTLSILAYGDVMRVFFAWKVGLVATMLTLSALHDYVLGPRLARALETGQDSPGLRRTVNWIARLNLLITLGIVLVAVLLVRGAT